MKFQMQQNLTSIFEWTQKCSTQEAGLEELNWRCWDNGFICPKCSHDKSYQLKHRYLQECAKCDRQVSPTAGTVYEHTRLPLSKWFAAIYLVGADKGGILTEWLSKNIGLVDCLSNIEEITPVGGGRGCGYWLDGLVEVGDAFVGGRKPSKIGRGTKSKKPVIFAVEHRENHMGFMVVRLFERGNSKRVWKFAWTCSLPCIFGVTCIGTKPRPLHSKKWMTGFRRFISSLANSSVFWWVTGVPLQSPIPVFLPDRLLQDAADRVPLWAFLPYSWRYLDKN